MIDDLMMEPLLTSKEVGTLLAVSQPTLSRWRTDGTGPRHVNLNGIPRYRAEDVTAWVEEKRK